MLPPVREDVHERVPHLARRPQHACVVAIAPHAPTAGERAVHRFGDSDRESLDTAPEARRLVCLYQQMQMIGLHAEL